MYMILVIKLNNYIQDIKIENNDGNLNDIPKYIEVRVYMDLLLC